MMAGSSPPIGSGNGIGSREPVTVAGAAMIAVQAMMAAFWSTLADTGNLGGLTSGTQSLITGAITALATVIILIWTARKTTPRAAPVLQGGTKVTVTNGDPTADKQITLPDPADTLPENHGD